MCLSKCCIALKIHVSGDCKRILDKLGGYETEPRGNVSMKVRNIFVSQFSVRNLAPYHPYDTTR